MFKVQYIFGFLIIILIITGCNKRINNSISINYTFNKEDTSNFFCFYDEIKIKNNTNDSLYLFWSPNYYLKNKLGLKFSNWSKFYETERNYYKSDRKIFWDSLSKDNKNLKKHNQNYSNTLKDIKQFHQELFMYYIGNYKIINNTKFIDTIDSSKIHSIISYQFYPIL